jgi:hypothetical protein
VCRLLGSAGRGPLSSRLRRKIDRYIDRARRIIKPKILFTTSRAEKAGEGAVALAGGTVLQSARLSRCLGECDRAAVFVGTVGEGMDEVVRSLSEQNRVGDAFIFDAIGSAAVEEVIGKFHDRFDALAVRRGEGTTLRFSPGYCDWRVNEQEKLFGLLDAGAIGVRLTSSCLMEPRKSVSGVFGIGDAEKIDREGANPCRSCGLRRCIARRAG